MTSLLIADWYPHGKDGYFRKFEIYNMLWSSDVSLNTVTLTCASFGGPIAVMRDRSKIVKVQGSGKPVIAIYTSSGRLVSSLVWNSGPLLQLGWSSTEDLLCVQEDGAVLMYDMFAKYIHTFKMDKEVEDTKAIKAIIFRSPVGTGVAVLTMSYRVFLVNNVKDAKVRRLSKLPSPHAPVNAWSIISGERNTHALVARGKDLYLLNESEHAQLQHIDFGDEDPTIVAMEISPGYKQIVFLSKQGKLWIGSIDLRRNFRMYDTRSQIPKQIVWCGLDAVVLNWENSIDVVGCYEDNIEYAYDSPVHLVQELDCVRVISTSSHEILQKVPQVVQDIFCINSTSPSSYLLEASKHFQNRSHRANEYIHLVQNKLSFAVYQCIEGAGHEFHHDTQKLLIKAAQFGKSFIPEYDPEGYVHMCRALRALNAVRDSKVGLPITYEQLQYLSLQTLLDLLMNRRHYYLAIQVAKYLQIPSSSSILSHWAYYKMQQSQLDYTQVAREIAEKLGRTAGVSYTDIAKKAADLGRTQLAIKLLDYEPRATLQVPLLLHLGQDMVALVKAIESGNTDLVYTVFLHLKENMQLAKFQLDIRKYPLGQALYLKYCKEHNTRELRDVFTQEDAHEALAACFIRESYDPKNSGTLVASLAAALDSLKKARNDLHTSLCEKQMKLLKYQRTLEEKFHRDFFNKSLHDTMKMLLCMQQVKLAEGLRSEYKVPDRRYWWLRVECLGETEDWPELEKLSKVKKSPIGYEPFVDVCLKHKNHYEAQKYISRVRDDHKVKYLVQLGMMEEARQLAIEQRDLDMLLYIQTKGGETPEVAALIAAMATAKK